MIDTKEFRGLWTALITPFKEGDWISNEVDYEALKKVLENKIKDSKLNQLTIAILNQYRFK